MNTAAPGTRLTRTHKALLGVVTGGAVVIAGIGFAGSYDAVSDLALEKGFGDFAKVFPLGVDIGIGVLLALDLLLCWFRIPFPLLRQTAWMLTAATIAFNAAAAWPDPIGVGMHAVIPVLFVIVVEAARHAVGRIADIAADRHIDSPPMSRWLLALPSTFRIWRRMRLWQLRSYEDVIALEREAAKYRTQLRATYGRTWRRKAAAHELLALRFARLGTPIADTLARHEEELAAANERQQQRQNGPETTTTGDSNTANDSAKNAGGGARKPRRKPAKKTTSGGNTRRPMAKWVELTAPIFHRQFHELRRQPTAKEFADAIANEGLGSVSDSTAKNIRQAVLDNEPLPTLD